MIAKTDKLVKIVMACLGMGFLLAGIVFLSFWLGFLNGQENGAKLCLLSIQFLKSTII